MAEISQIKLPDNTSYDLRASAIPFGIVDSSSTSTAFTVTVPGITALEDGVICMLKNGKVTSASGFTINVNGLGAKPVYSNMAAATADTTIFNVNYTMIFVYDETRISGGCWICYRGYNSNDNTIGYQIRTGSLSLPVSGATGRYRILFTSPDGTHFVPSTLNTSTNATAKRDVNTAKIDPFGRIVYYSSTTVLSAEGRPGASSLWQQYTFALGYSFNRTGAALTMTLWTPVFVKCAPQSDGSAIIDADTPFVQELPSTEDGKIYIWLGIAYSATNIELTLEHPVYEYKNGGIRQWTNLTNWLDGSAAGSVRAINSATEDENYTIGQYAFAEGYNSKASGYNSHAEGNQTTASDSNAHTEGYNTTASNSNAHAEGGTTTASGVNSHAEGASTTASGMQSHAEGGGTIASGDASHAEGGGSRATTQNAHAEGGGTLASGVQSHAEGAGTTASGEMSHAEGVGTTASGTNSHAEGEGSTATGMDAHAEGSNTIATHKAQHVFGMCNIADTSTAQDTARGNYVEIVGNGTSINARSNARTLDWNGNEVLAGKLTVGTVGTNSMDVATVGQIPIITLNGTATTSPSFYAPTTAGSNGYVLKSNGGGAPTWTSATLTDTKVTTAALTSGTLYYPILATGTGTATRQIDSTLNGLTYKSTAGTASIIGTAKLTIGNSIASGRPDNEQGQIILYGSTAYAHTIVGEPTINRTITLPNASGTLALNTVVTAGSSISSGGLMSQADKTRLDGLPDVVELTQAEYDELSTSEKNNGTIYYITDIGGGQLGNLRNGTAAGSIEMLTTVALKSYQVALGTYNKADTGTGKDLSNFAFIIGNGTSDNARSNLFTINKSGLVTTHITPTEDYDWDTSIAPVETQYFTGFEIRDSVGVRTTHVDTHSNNNGTVVAAFGAERVINGEIIRNQLFLQIEADGTKSYWLDNPAKFATAIGLGYSVADCTRASGWVDYNSGMPPTVTKSGGVCTFQWVAKPTASSVTIGGSNIAICTIPSGFRPRTQIYAIHQGSGSSIFMVTISTDGIVYIQRLRENANANGVWTNGSASSYNWFPISLTYICAQ